MSRVDSVFLAVHKARQAGHDPAGTVLASDGFFPFADNIELAAGAKVTAVIQPGGSVRDAEVVEAANRHRPRHGDDRPPPVQTLAPSL
jgi:AICAR transformylase/IMP cyclohydrolase PurH (only IMP cyclohydrolase domain in Aful)